MRVTVESREKLAKLPSASGIERVQVGGRQRIFVVGDDSSQLYSFDSNFFDRREYTISDKRTGDDGRIPKKKKPDFEAITSYQQEAEVGLLIFGSGSKDERRDTLVQVELTETLDVYRVSDISLTRLYEKLRNDKSIVGEGKLNIEAASIDNNKLILFQRGSTVSPNCALIFELEDFLKWIIDSTKKPPEFNLRTLRLPLIGGVQSGFSGATTFSERRAIIFSASSENRIDADEDAKVFGSLIGKIELEELYGSKNDITPDIAEIKLANQSFTGKVESLAFSPGVPDGIRLLAVTDDDLGGSEVLTVKLTGI